MHLFDASPALFGESEYNTWNIQPKKRSCKHLFLPAVTSFAVQLVHQEWKWQQGSSFAVPIRQVKPSQMKIFE